MNRTVSGCAIMLLVEVDRIETQSYATDAALLAELRAAWPPGAPAAEGGEQPGYVRVEMASLEPVGAVRLTDRLGVALAAGPGSPEFVAAPVVRDDGGWRRAAPGDGVSAFVAGVPLASERPVGVDQTHESVVVGERAIVKWFRRVGPAPSRATGLIAHLAAVGFAGMPAPLESLAWRAPGGPELTLAQGDAFLPGARDGWEWCVARADAGDESAGVALGELVGELHGSLATPSGVIREPLAAAGADAVARWRRDAIATLDEALDLADDPELREMPLRPTIEAAFDALAGEPTVAMQPVHGDLHVGQFLEWPDGLVVIDFDGNPALRAEANAVRQPRERDVAQLLSSLDHVGRVVAERAEGRRDAEMAVWIGAARAAFLDAVGPVDGRLLAAFELEQECRELVYAARFLPRWRYAPMATLRARFRGG